MSDLISIPADLLAETRAALDAALCIVEGSPDVYAKVAASEAKLAAIIRGKSDTIPPEKRQEGYQLLRHLDEVRRKVKKDYGLEK